MALLGIKQFSHVALNVREIKRSTAFYQNILGLQVIFETELPDGIGFSSGVVTPMGLTIELIQLTGLVVEVPENISTLAFSVGNLEEAKTALLSSGVEVKNEMEFDGVRMFFISDPDGHNIEICQFPGGISNAAELHGH
ncbi:MAG: VOC family protein [Pseudomonadales bacterium]